MRELGSGFMPKFMGFTAAWSRSRGHRTRKAPVIYITRPMNGHSPESPTR